MVINRGQRFAFPPACHPVLVFILPKVNIVLKRLPQTRTIVLVSHHTPCCSQMTAVLKYHGCISICIICLKRFILSHRQVITASRNWQHGYLSLPSSLSLMARFLARRSVIKTASSRLRFIDTASSGSQWEYQIPLRYSKCVLLNSPKSFKSLMFWKNLISMESVREACC